MWATVTELVKVGSWVQIPTESVIAGALGKPTYVILLPLHTKEVSNGTCEGTDGIVD